VASIRKIRGRDGRRRDSAVRRRGRGSRGTSAHAARRAVAQRPGAGTRVLGVHGLTGRCECARCVTWGSNLPDGDPKILGRDPESRIFFWNTRFFPCCACHFRKSWYRAIITPRLGLHHQSGRIWKGRGQGSTLGLVLVARPKANELSAEADAPEFDRGRGEMRQGRDAPGFDRGTARTAPTVAASRTSRRSFFICQLRSTVILALPRVAELIGIVARGR